MLLWVDTDLWPAYNRPWVTLSEGRFKFEEVGSILIFHPHVTTLILLILLFPCALINRRRRYSEVTAVRFVGINILYPVVIMLWNLFTDRDTRQLNLTEYSFLLF